jgi:hypothetical protein
VNGKNLYLRGRANLDGIIEELETSYGFLSQSTDVIVSGTSAGGLATYLHGSYFKSRINSKATVVSVPDAGFFFDHANFYGVHSFRNEMSGAIVASFWNSTLRGDAAKCVADKAPTNTTWQCFFPEHLYPYQTSTPFFILNSLYDTAQMSLIFDLPCNLYTSCNLTEAAAVQQYANDLKATIIQASSLFPSRDGFFLTSCYQHEESCKPWDWFGIQIQGNTPNSTLYNWYTKNNVQPTTLVDVPWPNDGSCSPQGSKWDHGAC